jgi:hypothetical protein
VKFCVISSPKNKYIRITKDENFSHDKHYLSNTPAMADSMCSYDLDQIDEAWLQQFNGERSMCGLVPVKDEQFERIIEELEVIIVIRDNESSFLYLSISIFYFVLSSSISLSFSIIDSMS